MSLCNLAKVLRTGGMTLDPPSPMTSWDNISHGQYLQPAEFTAGSDKIIYQFDHL